ncbi:MAG: ATP-binding protein [Ignavibacteriales bacterium]|nr:ATP-binding protein [Ignavibacteriales bacterium]
MSLSLRRTGVLAQAFTAVSVIAFSQPVLHLQPLHGFYNPAHFAQILEDPNKGFEFSNVSNPLYSSRFTPIAKEVLSLGYTTAAIWVKVSLINQRQESELFVLEVAYPLLDRIDFFLTDGRGNLKVSAKSGIAVSLPEEKNDRNHTFRFFLNSGEDANLFMRVEASGALVLPMTLWTESEFARKNRDEFLILGMYYGVLSIMIFYNLVLFFSIRDINYLYYGILVFAYGISQFNFDGFLSMYFPGGHSWWTLRVFPIAFSLNSVIVLLLTQRLLGTETSVPSFDKLMNISKLIGLTWLIAVFFLPGKLSYPVTSILTAFTVVLIIPPAVIRWRQGYQPALPFTLAIVALSAAVFIRMFRNLGVMADASVTIHTVHFGTLLDAVFLSIALGDRINLRKIEQEVEKVKLRDRLARDLHDDLASTLGSISLFATSLKNALKKPSRKTRQLVDKITSLSTDAVDTIGDIVWSVSPERDTLNNLFTHMRDLVSQVCTANRIRYDVQMTTDAQDVWLNPDVRRNVFLIFKEALNNVVKHSKAHMVKVRAGITGQSLEMVIEDDGRGFHHNTRTERGHGLRNMEKRAKEIRGQLSIASDPGKGTSITFSRRMT